MTVLEFKLKQYFDQFCIFFCLTFQTNYSAICKSHFKELYCIGKGGFGKVWKVQRKKAKHKELYAMKEMSKARILTKRSVKSVMNER